MALIDKASLLMVPSTYEAGKLYNVLPSGNRAPDNKGGAGYDQTRADFDFDRGSNAAATRINSSGLIEKYRENEALQSNSFNVSPFWSLGNSILTANATTSPTGQSNATKIESNGINQETRTRQTISGATTGKVYTFSCYMKAGNVSYGIVRHYGISSNGRAWFNLSNGTIGTKDATLIDAKIESVGDGWYRCSITGKITTSGALDLAPAPNDNDYLSDAAGEYIFLYGAQAETGLVATEYLNSTSVTAKAGVLIDLPRINFDANGENGALLLEPSRQQLIQFSEYLGHSSWIIQNGSIATNNTTSPDGYINADKLTEDTATDVHRVTMSHISGTGNYNYSVFAKANSRNIIYIQQPWNNSQAWFNLSTGAVLTQQNCTGKIEPYGNGWYRCSIQVNVTSGPNGMYFGIATADQQFTYTGNGTGSAWFFGMQLEAGSYISSYIPNHGTSGGVTRAADSCSVTGASDVIGQTEGTALLDIISDDIGGNIALRLSDGTNSNRVTFEWSGSKVPYFVVQSGGSLVVYQSVTCSQNVRHKIAIGYKANDFVIYIDGVLAASDTSGAVPTSLTQIEFGEGSSKFMGKYNKFTLFKERLTNAELATLTTL